MTPRLRRFALTAHVILSIGWIGSVVAFLALVVTAMTGSEERLRAAWIAMETIGRFAIIPLAIASLLTGIVMALATRWGLFRHYWVLISFVLTILANVILLLNMRVVSRFAALAAGTPGTPAEVLRGGLPSELLHAGVGLVVLLAIDVLNVYKPSGMTPYGRRQESRSPTAATAAKRDGLENTKGRRVRVSLAVAMLAIVAALLILHLAGGGMGVLHR